MVATISQTEAIPATYPASPAGLSAAAAALSAPMLWQRLEGYVAHRWTSRAIVWVAEGPGDWQPPLKPATISTVERWTGEAWEATTDLLPSALGGYQLPGCGPYRFTGTVGSGTPPATVLEAFRRLAEYMATTDEKPGARSFSETVPDVYTGAVERSPAWMAQALVNSGAADLLRRYRRA
ncbi:hypothetical protein [Reyranella sp.]|uniref:hypothetical protein n=1 Tax=Reyranella sp. TaxID=1929291 RepID=UPI002730391A|nr:hypothetical protein [Reyranella sp.]MDP2376095.1 hypothetical protein [Reyranella sp.]